MSVPDWGLCEHGTRLAKQGSERTDPMRPSEQRLAAYMEIGSHIMDCEICRKALGMEASWPFGQ